MKKIISVLLTLAMLVSMLPMLAVGTGAASQTHFCAVTVNSVIGLTPSHKSATISPSPRESAGVASTLGKYPRANETGDNVMGSGLQELVSRQKLAEWSERVAECRSSGKTVRDWCTEHSVSTASYFRWQKRLFEMAAAE